MAKVKYADLSEEQKERIRERNRKWHKDHREYLRGKHAEWRAANREHVRKSQKEAAARRRAANPEKYEAKLKRERERLAAQRAANPEHFKQRDAIWRKNNPESTRRRNRKQALRRYGLTPAEYDAMIKAQDGRCAICGTDRPGGRGWHIDHCHETKSIRRLLCTNCNLGIGHLQHDIHILQAAIDYLKQFQAPRQPAVRAELLVPVEPVLAPLDSWPWHSAD